MPIRSLLTLASLAAGLTGLNAGAQGAKPEFEYKIDPVNSSVIFKVLNRDVSYVYGRFDDLAGVIIVDNRKNPKRFDVRCTIPAKSVDTNSKKRDKHLKSGDFFNVRKFKEISFETKKSKKITEGKFELDGALTLMGKTLPLTVDLDFTGAKSMGSQRLIGAHVSFTIKRSDFGMTQQLKGIADEVAIFVSLQAVYKMPPAG